MINIEELKREIEARRAKGFNDAVGIKLTVLGELLAELEQAKAVVKDSLITVPPAGEMPALPEPWIRNMDAPEGSRDHYAEDQMHAYARQYAAQQVRDMETRKDAAYYERNQVVAALAKCFPSGVAKTTIEGWSEDWHGCVYIDLPTGQASWHFHDSHAHLFSGLPPYVKAWDGHSTEEKYARIGALSAQQAKGDAELLDWLQDNFHSRPLDDFERRIQKLDCWIWMFYAPADVQGNIRDVLNAARALSQTAKKGEA